MTKYFMLFLIIVIISLGDYSRSFPKVNDIKEGNADSTNIGVNSPTIENIEITNIKITADTLLVILTGDFIYYPFGMYNSIEALTNNYSANLKINTFDEYPYDDTTTNKLKTYKLNLGNSFVKFVKDESKNKLEIVSARVFDKEIKLSNGIGIGITKEDFINKLSLKMSQYQLKKINIVLLESSLTGIWHYYCFKDDTLNSFSLDSDFQLKKD